MEIPRLALSSNYVKGKLIGKGAFGKVYVGVEKVSKDVVAIKEHEIDTENVNKISQLLAEVKILQTLTKEHCHPNILCYRDFFVDVKTGKMYLITNFIKGRTLEDSRTSILEREHGYDTLFSMLESLLHAIHYIHEHDIIHSDIKPENIMIRDNQPILIDFGLSCFSDKKCRTRGSLLYMSPESLKTGTMTKKCDIWALGMTFNEICNGDPYPDVYDTEELKKIIKIGKKFKLTTPHLKLNKLLNDMLLLNASKRLTASELLATHFT